jgi:hypothetical protein
MRKKVIPLALAAAIAGATSAAAQPATDGYGDVPGVNRTVAGGSVQSDRAAGNQLAETGLDAGFFGVLGVALLAGGVLLRRTAKPDGR